MAGMAGGFVAGSIVSRLLLDTTAWDVSVAKVSAGLPAMAAKAGAAGRKLTRSVTLPLLAMGAAAVKVAADFDQSITESLAIMGDVSEETREKMEDAALEMSGASTFAAKELGEAYFFLASAGMDAEQAIGALPAVTRFAQAGAFSLTSATDLLTDAQSALGLVMEDAEDNYNEMVHVSDVLVGANTLANASVEQFSTALTNKAGPAMRSVNMDIEEGVAVLAAFADQGVKGALAGNQLAIMLTNMETAQRNNSEQWETFGVALYDAEGGMNDMADVIGDIETLLEGMSVKQKSATLAQMGFNDRAMKSIKVLLGTSEKIRGYNDDLKDMAGITQEVADKQLLSFTNQLKLLRNEAVNVGIEFGQELIPILRDHILPVLKDVVGWFSDLTDEQKELAVKVGIAVAALGPMLTLIGKIPALAAAATSSMGLLVISIGAAYAAYEGLIWIRGKVRGDATAEQIAISDEIGKWNDLKKAVGGFTEFLNEAAKEEVITQEEKIALWEKYRRAGGDALQELMESEDGKKLAAFLVELTGKHEGAALAATGQAGALDGLGESADDAAESIETLDAAFEDAQGTLETFYAVAVPAARDMGDVYADAITSMEEVTERTFGEGGPVRTTLREQETFFGTFADGLVTKWSSMYGDMIYEVLKLPEDTLPIFNAVVQQISDMAGQAFAKWLVGFILPFKSSAKDAVETVVGSTKDVAKAATDLAAGFSPTGMIATAIGTAIGSFLSNLLGPKGAGERDTQLIKDNTWNTNQNVINLHDANVARLDAIKETGWSIWGVLQQMPDWESEQINLLRIIGINSNEMVHILEGVTKAQHGAVHMQPELAMVGEQAPQVPEITMPMEWLSQLAPAGGGGGKTQVNLNFEGGSESFDIEGAVVDIMIKQSPELTADGRMKINTNALTQER